MPRADYETLRGLRPDLKLVAWDSFQEWVHDALAELSADQIVSRATASFIQHGTLESWEWIWIVQLLKPEAA